MPHAQPIGIPGDYGKGDGLILLPTPASWNSALRFSEEAWFANRLVFVSASGLNRVTMVLSGYGIGRHSVESGVMHVLIIGGTGNISSAVVTHLMALGHRLTLITRGQRSVPEGCALIQADRRDAGAIRQALRGDWPEVILNFLGFELADVSVDFDLFGGQVRQYVFISSATVYAKPHRVLPVTEQAPLGNQYWEYARKKQECEEWLMRQHRSHGFPVTVVRPSHTYSPSWLPNPVSSAGYTFATRLRAGQPVWVPDAGQVPWTLTATADFAEGLVGLVGCQESVGEAFHLTSDEALPWNQIIRTTAEAFGAPEPRIVGVPTEFIAEHFPDLGAKLKGDKANASVFDNAKIRRFVPGFRCRTPFREGIRECARWFEAHPESRTLDAQVDGLFERVIRAWTELSGQSRPGGLID